MNLKSMVDFVSQYNSSQVEAYFEQYHLTEIKTDNHGFNFTSSSLTRGLGIRVVDEGRLGFAHTSDLDNGSIQSTCNQAWKNCQLSSYQGAVIPSDDKLPPEGQWSHPSLDRFHISDGLRIIDDIRNGARCAAKSLSVLGINVTVGRRVVQIANNQNIAREFEASYFNNNITVSVSNGFEHSTGHVSIFGRDIDRFDAEKLGMGATEMALQALGATPCVEGEMPVIFTPTASTQLLGAIAPIFVAHNNTGLLRNKAGRQVASPLLTIIDDPTRSEIVGSGPFDGEGVAGYKKSLIENGILQGALHNSQTARQNGLAASTGNATRYAYSDLPGVGLSILYIKPGHDSRQKLIQNVKDGLLVTKLRGVATGINPMTGTISVNIVGQHIVNGEPVKPVKNVTIVGFITDVLERVVAVGEDLWFRGPIGSPSISIDHMRVLRANQ